MWQITDMPQRTASGRDYIGWMRWGDIHVKIQISSQGVTDEAARLIIQNLAGFITEAGLETSLSRPQSRGEGE
jgi:hypothetical protein